MGYSKVIFLLLSLELFFITAPSVNSTPLASLQDCLAPSLRSCKSFDNVDQITIRRRRESEDTEVASEASTTEGTVEDTTLNDSSSSTEKSTQESSEGPNETSSEPPNETHENASEDAKAEAASSEPSTEDSSSTAVAAETDSSSSNSESGAETTSIAPNSESEATSTPSSESEAPSTPGSESEAPSTPGSESEAPSTPGSESEAPSTPGSESEAPSTPGSESEAPFTPGSESEAPSTPGSESEAPSTPDSESEEPSTPGSESEAPSTPDSESEEPSTPGSESEAPSTPSSESEVASSTAETATSEESSTPSSPSQELDTVSTPSSETEAASSTLDFNSNSEAETLASSSSPEVETEATTIISSANPEAESEPTSLSPSSSSEPVSKEASSSPDSSSASETLPTDNIPSGTESQPEVGSTPQVENEPTYSEVSTAASPSVSVENSELESTTVANDTGAGIPSAETPLIEPSNESTSQPEPTTSIEEASSTASSELMSFSLSPENSTELPDLSTTFNTGAMLESSDSTSSSVVSESMSISMSSEGLPEAVPTTGKSEQFTPEPDMTITTPTTPKPSIAHDIATDRPTTMRSPSNLSHHVDHIFSDSFDSSLSDLMLPPDYLSNRPLEPVEGLQTDYDDYYEYYEEEDTNTNTPPANVEYPMFKAQTTSPGCVYEDKERFQRTIFATVYSKLDGEPTMLTFLKDAACVGTLSKKGYRTVRSRGMLIPQLPLALKVEAGMFMHDRLYLFDSSPAQKVWSFKYNQAKRIYSLKAHSVMSVDAFLQICGIKRHPINNFRVKAVAQFSLHDPTCIVYDKEGDVYVSKNATYEALSLVDSIRHLMSTQFITRVQSVFSWMDEPSANSVYVYGSDGELYELYRKGDNDAKIWTVGKYRRIPYENAPIPQ